MYLLQLPVKWVMFRLYLQLLSSDQIPIKDCILYILTKDSHNLDKDKLSYWDHDILKVDKFTSLCYILT